MEPLLWGYRFKRIITITDPSAHELREKAKNWDDPRDPVAVEIAKRMLALVGVNPNMAGLSATQLGIQKRIIIVNSLALVNPIITYKSITLWDAWEGCWSLPTIGALVERPIGCYVRGYDPISNNTLVHQLKGWDARIAMHEIDHLDGILITDIAKRTFTHPNRELTLVIPPEWGEEAEEKWEKEE